jgi:hypothetical protein
MSAHSNDKKIKDLKAKYGEWLPDIGKYQQDYFGDLEQYLPKAEKLSRDVSESDLSTALALRERATPGITEGLRRSGDSLFALMRGELPDSVLDAYSRAGGAASIGSGLRGDVNFLNQGLFGARGALGGMQLGYNLLPAFLGAQPNVNVTSPMSFLSQLVNPTQRTNTQLSVRGQNLGIASKVAGMPTGGDAWASFLSSTGGALTGAGMMGMGGMGGGGGSGAGAGAGATAANFDPYVAPQASPSYGFSLY